MVDALTQVASRPMAVDLKVNWRELTILYSIYCINQV